MQRSVFKSVVPIVVAVCVAAGFYNASAAVIESPRLSHAIGSYLDAPLIHVDDSLEEELVLFSGDVLLARAVEWAMDEHGSAYPYMSMYELMQAHTHTIINFEASIPNQHEPTPALKMNFSVDPQHIVALRESGVTHASLANNHSFDYAKDGYLNTKIVLGQNGITSFGKPYTLATTSVTFIEGDVTIALIGIDLTQTSYTDDELSLVFAYAAEHSDQQVVVVHWGEEYRQTHTKQQELYAKLFVKLGADLVVGHHPHVVQDIAVIDGVLVFYSLGNYIFDQYFSDDVQEGLLLSWDPRAGKIKLIPVTSIGSRNQPRVMPGLEKESFLEELSAKSSKELRDDILNSVLAF